MNIANILCYFIQTVITFRNPLVANRCPNVYVEKCLEMATKNYKAIDVVALDKHREVYKKCFIENETQETGTLEAKKAQRTAKLGELYESRTKIDSMLDTIDNETTKFLRFLIEGDGYNCIDVLYLIYKGVEVKLSYIKMISKIIVHSTTDTNQNKEQDDLATSRKTEQKQTSKLTMNKELEEELFPQWICLVKQYKDKCKMVLDKYTKLSKGGDISSITKEKTVGDTTLDLHYEYSKAFNDFIKEHCWSEDEELIAIYNTLGTEKSVRYIENVVSYTKLESELLLIAIQKYNGTSASCHIDNANKEKFMKWHKETKQRYPILQESIKKSCTMIKRKLLNFAMLISNGRNIQQFNEDISAIENIQNQILEVMRTPTIGGLKQKKRFIGIKTSSAIAAIVAALCSVVLIIMKLR